MSGPDPIPVYVGDDWSFAFSYRKNGGNGEPVDLTGAKIVCQFFTPFSGTPITLTQDAGQTGLIDAAEGQFGIFLHKASTASIAASTSKESAVLNIAIEAGGLLRTIAVWPLNILSRRQPPPPPLVNITELDPINGCVLTFLGITDFFASHVVSGKADFSKSSQSGLAAAAVL